MWKFQLKTTKTTVCESDLSENLNSVYFPFILRVEKPSPKLTNLLLIRRLFCRLPISTIRMQLRGSEERVPNIEVLSLLNDAIKQHHIEELKSLLNLVVDPLEDCGRRNSPMHHIIDAYFNASDIRTRASFLSALEHA